jgi:hypothetical protein
MIKIPEGEQDAVHEVARAAHLPSPSPPPTFTPSVTISLSLAFTSVRWAD